MRKSFVLFLVALFTVPYVATAQPETAHPRLWLTPSSLAQYRTWATDSNPFYVDSLLPQAEQAKQDMDEGNILKGDLGGNSYEDYVSENYAALFAFMSLIHPDETQRADYAQRSRTLLLRVMNEATKGSASGQPFRDPEFSINDRSRWYGVSFPLTVDWIYSTLTTEDKILIHKVFSRWMDELSHAEMTTMNHPEPIGVINDPVLTSDLDAVRWAGNNYYTAHMRNMGMMALSFDPADDTDGKFSYYLGQATGAWLYVSDYLLRTDAAGGLGTEGFEYSPQSVGYVAQFLLALHTAGADDAAKYGTQVVFSNNPFWDDSLKAYLNSISPATIQNPDTGDQVYQPAWYGSGQNYLTPDFIELFGTLGIYDLQVNNVDRLNALRWIQTNTPMGGAGKLVDRSDDASEFYKSVLYFMLFDPTISAPTDPRPNFPTTWYAAGMRRLLSRTDWTDKAAWFTYNLSWDRVDHQAANGNAIEFYRDGEWLTKIQVGYDLDFLTSDHMNTVTVQNDPLDRDDYRHTIWERGSQWLYASNNPPQPIYSTSDNYLFVTGDSTNLYNTDYEELDGVTHVSRSLLWLKPDMIVIYDRAATRSDNRPKHFWLNLPTQAAIETNRINMTTDKGQHLYITSLLPNNADITVSSLQDEASGAPANYETMKYRLGINAGGAKDVRFLTVLQGANTDTTPVTPSNLSCTNGYEGVELKEWNTSVLFAHDLNQAFTTSTCELPASITTIYVTGLQPNSTYDILSDANSHNAGIIIKSGTSYTADQAGVVVMTRP